MMAKAAAPYRHPQLAAVAHRHMNADGSPIVPTVNLTIMQARRTRGGADADAVAPPYGQLRRLARSPTGKAATPSSKGRSLPMAVGSTAYVHATSACVMLWALFSIFLYSLFLSIRSPTPHPAIAVQRRPSTQGHGQPARARLSPSLEIRCVRNKSQTREAKQHERRGVTHLHTPAKEMRLLPSPARRARHLER
jgi:hypothetical protein